MKKQVEKRHVMSIIQKKILIFFLILFLVPVYALTAVIATGDYSNTADIVIFSYHRPMQLYALCESLQKYITQGRGNTYVIYRADTDEYRTAYAVVQEDFPDITYIQQGQDPHSDFKPLTLQAAFESPCEYILFAVDDIIVKDEINISECIELLEKTGAYGFYLRLGSNLTECYTLHCAQPLPRLHKLTDTTLYWQLSQGHYDWGYPHTVDMTVYRKSYIEQAFRDLSYTAPNRLEGYWAQQEPYIKEPIGLCYITSKIVNIPCNRVQDVFNNRHMNMISVDELLHLFMQGKKIVIDDYAHIANRSAHAEYAFRFVDRVPQGL